MNADAAAHMALGRSNALGGRLAQAIDSFRQAARLAPDSAEIHHHLGVALLELGRHQEAAQALECALALDPRCDAGQPLLAALKALAAEHRQAGREAEASEALDRACALDCADADAHLRRGVLSIVRTHYADARAALERAAELSPDSAPIHYNLAIALSALGRMPEAFVHLDRALSIDPDHALARAQRPLFQARECDWSALEDDPALTATLGIEGPVLPPFALLPLEDAPERHRLRSERAIAVLDPVAAPSAARLKKRPKRLKIGYFSADFRNHPMMHLAGRMFGLHDRARFTVHGYSLGPPSDDPVRRSIVPTFDSFKDVGQLSDDAIAALARADGIDLAIDLMGHTQGCRMRIFAHRAAPLQISYLGYPGTTGAPFIDYLVADPVIIPDSERASYSERLIRLPHCYQVNDASKAIADTPVSRRAAGLPEEGFVFCCFNNVNKIRPAEFAIWMRLLGAVEGSVLWLLAGSEASRANLRREAERHGVDPARLVFATAAPLADHLARHRLADLFLDTFNYNAHTTGSDALWAELPLVTKAGRGFAARVGASLLSAIGLPDLIADSDDAYFALALDLAKNRERLGEVRARLAANRLTAPLFDTVQFTRHLEAGYEAAFARLLDGLPPADISIAPVGSIRP